MQRYFGLGVHDLCNGIRSVRNSDRTDLLSSLCTNGLASVLTKVFMLLPVNKKVIHAIDKLKLSRRHGKNTCNCYYCRDDATNVIVRRSWRVMVLSNSIRRHEWYGSVLSGVIVNFFFVNNRYKHRVIWSCSKS